MESQIVTTSTLIMTLLLLVGLFFFIRASGKDRTEIRQYRSNRSLEDMGGELRQYLQQRAYRLEGTDDTGLATFVGEAQPSGFLTALLTGLAGIGFLCLALVIQTVQPAGQGFPYLLLLGAPLAGWYYRQRNRRAETLRVRVSEADGEVGSVWVKIAAHRDELDSLEQQLSLETIWAD